MSCFRRRRIAYQGGSVELTEASYTQKKLNDNIFLIVAISYGQQSARDQLVIYKNY